MAEAVPKPSGKLGMSPGSLVYVGQQKGGEAELLLTEYGQDTLLERTLRADEIPASLSTPAGVAWLDVVGVHDVELLGRIGELLKVHPLVLEDIANTHQRPKVEFHEGYIFAVLRLACGEGEGECAPGELEQVSFLLGEGCLITLRERPGTVFDPVRARLGAGGGRLRKEGADYLMYALLDVVVDHYFAAVEDLSDRSEALEEEVLTRTTPETLRKIHAIKGESARLRRAAWPLREVVQALMRSDSELIPERLQPFLRDLSDHVIQVSEIMEMQRETLSSYMDLYVSMTGNVMNKTMAFLTVIATIFIPLTFIVGVYGMNFENMPELKWQYGYPLIWLVMLATGGGMWWWFRRNRML